MSGERHRHEPRLAGLDPKTRKAVQKRVNATPPDVLAARGREYRRVLMMWAAIVWKKEGNPVAVWEARILSREEGGPMPDWLTHAEDVIARQGLEKGRIHYPRARQKWRKWFDLFWCYQNVQWRQEARSESLLDACATVGERMGYSPEHVRDRCSQVEQLIREIAGSDVSAKTSD